MWRWRYWLAALRTGDGTRQEGRTSHRIPLPLESGGSPRRLNLSEDYALSKTNHKIFEEIDKAMGEFLTPLWEAKGKPPDPAKVKSAYNAYLEKLKLAD